MAPQVHQHSKPTSHATPSVSSRGSRRSSESHDSQSTAPTSLHNSPYPSQRFAQHRQASYDAEFAPICSSAPARSSAETYTSTIASIEEFCEEPEEIEPQYEEIPEYAPEKLGPQVRASTAQDFASFFPSTNRLFIRHDDSTYDGDMNLRVDTETTSKHGKEHVQLFHMRMHDLKTREFSLRRYCRDSGREVCRSNRKYAKPSPDGRPSLQRSMSNALEKIRGKPDFKRTNSGLSAVLPHRKDSGYASEDSDDDIEAFMSSPSKTKEPVGQETNVIKLEFSNYAHVDVKSTNKKHEFEYWGTNYAWKRTSEKDGHSKSISYHLVRSDGGAVIARIVPELQSPSQIKAEERAGCFVPPCSMWICDQSLLGTSTSTDVADVIIASGLTALIDESIKRRYEPKRTTSHVIHIGVPLTPLKMDMEYVGPKAMMEHVFKRRGSGVSVGSNANSPLRRANSVKAC